MPLSHQLTMFCNFLKVFPTGIASTIVSTSQEYPKNDLLDDLLLPQWQHINVFIDRDVVTTWSIADNRMT